MEEAKGQSILDKMLTTFINTLVKAAENEAQTHFGKNLEEVLKHFMAKVNSDFEKQCLLWYFTKKGQTMTVSSEVFERIAKAAVASRAASEKLFHGPQKVSLKERSIIPKPSLSMRMMNLIMPWAVRQSSLMRRAFP